MKIEKDWMRSSRADRVLLGGLLMLAGCVSEYNVHDAVPVAGGGSAVVQVRPSKFWHKPGVPAKVAWDTWQQCMALPGNKDVTDACMKEQGFIYGMLPPPAPRKGWVKPGVSYVEATHIKGACLWKEHSQEYLDQCMGEQGFVYRELTEEELPPCWYVWDPPCKREPNPSR